VVATDLALRITQVKDVVKTGHVCVLEVILARAVSAEYNFLAHLSLLCRSEANAFVNFRIMRAVLFVAALGDWRVLFGEIGDVTCLDREPLDPHSKAEMEMTDGNGAA
jgi:hypothetical protein